MESSNLVADRIDLLISKTTLEVKEKMKKIKGNGMFRIKKKRQRGQFRTTLCFLFFADPLAELYRVVRRRITCAAFRKPLHLPRIPVLRIFSSWIQNRKTRVSSSSSAISNDSVMSEIYKSSSVNGPTNTPITASESELSMLKTNNERSSRESRSGFSIGASSIPYSHSVADSRLADVSPGLVFYSTDGKYKMKLQMNGEKPSGRINPRVSCLTSKDEDSQRTQRAASLSGSVSTVLSSPAKSEEKVFLPVTKEKPIEEASCSWSQLAECATSIGTKLSVIDGGREHSLRLKAGLVNGKFDTLVINGKNIKLSQ